MDPDRDLEEMTHAELVQTARDMRRAIRAHRDASGHDLCWYHPELWGLLPDTPDTTPAVPEWETFMKGCAAYRASLDTQARHLPRTDTTFVEGDTP